MNNRLNKRISRLAKVLSAGMLLGVWSSAPALLTVPNIPLFLASDVQANIFFSLDDSGSMDWEVLVSPVAQTVHTKTFPGLGVILLSSLNVTSGAETCDPGDITTSRVGGVRTRFIDCTTSKTVTPPTSGDLDSSPNDIFEDLEYCRGYNVLAYNPGTVYTPWIGVDINGNAYADQSITAARINPYDPAAGTTDLTANPNYYGVWIDDGDGVYEAGECPVGNDPPGTPADAATEDGIPGGPPDFNTRTFTDPKWVAVTTLSAADQTNYANWWSYYRKREHILKRAISELINNSQQRMGLATLHNNNTVGTPVRDMRSPTDKETLMASLFQIDSSGGTPLRLLLDNTGHYFDDSDNDDLLHGDLGITEGTPLLPAADGGECQQNFGVLFSDGFWNGADPTVGNTDIDGAGPFDGGPHADSVSNTLADVAMKYYETDLSGTLPNTVPTLEGTDENDQQHLVVYTVSFGLEGTLTAAPADHDPATPPPPWPTPVSNQITTTDDMRHAAYNSRGDFLPGQDAQGLIDSLNDALASISTRTGSASAVAATSTQIQTDTLIFQGRFDTENWDGKLNAIPLNSDGTITQPVVPDWEASSVMPAAASRNIFTFIGDGTTLGDEFEWANLTAAQQALVGSEPILDFVRGDRSQELANGGAFRNRIPPMVGGVLADIIDSSPIAVTSDLSPPPYQQLPGTQGSTYLQFVRNTLSRIDMVYVGANGGMMHGFRTDTGVEQLAYVPRALFDELGELTNPAYSHRFYVDGQLQIGPAFFDGAWHTMLVGALGRGGAALFGLDVTDPGNFNSNDVLWELTDPELGMVLGEVQIVRMNDGQWYGVTGNGYNSASEQASLLIIDLSDGSIVRRIDTGVGGPLTPNGLGEVIVVDLNEDLTADVAYGGDLLGNVWKFDLDEDTTPLTPNADDDDPADWDVALGGAPLYTALDANGDPQAITTRPSFLPHPDGGLLVLFGTGRYFVQGDDNTGLSPQVNTFYGIRDQGSSVASITTRDDSVLQSQDIIFEDVVTFGAETISVRALSDNSVDWPNQDGWYLDLVSPVNGAEGERVIADPQVRFGRIIFNTFIPAESCNIAGGGSFLMEFDALTGARLDFTVFDLNQDGIFDEVEFVTLPDGTRVPVSGKSLPLTLAPPAVVSDQEGTKEFKITAGLSGDIETTAELGSRTTLGRQSWRQIR